MALIIGVFGSAAGNISDEAKGKAREIGRQIAKQGHVLVTGACSGLPFEAVLGASEAGGKCIGFSPAVDAVKQKELYDIPLDCFSQIVFVPNDFKHAKDPLVCKKYRNVLSTAFVEAGIIIGGRIGTMNEFTLLYDLGKKIGVLEGSGGITEKSIKSLIEEAGKETGAKIIFDENPERLVKRLAEL